MIIRNNLSSSPVRNYTLYFLGCLAVVGALIAFTAWNISSLTGSRSEIGQLQTKIVQQERQAAQLRAQADQLNSQISGIKTKKFSEEVAFMNNAIKRRVFSWSRLFDLFERMLPKNVKMVSVLPNIRGDQITITMQVAGKSLNDIVELIRVLENSIVFSDVTLRNERQDDSGVLQASVSLRYLPEEKEVLPAAASPASDVPEEPENEEPQQEEEQLPEEAEEQ